MGTVLSGYTKPGDTFTGYVIKGQKDGTTLGEKATAEGYNNTASGLYSHAEGDTNQAIGSRSHAEGRFTITTADYSHAEGNMSQAIAANAHAEGFRTVAGGQSAHVEGESTIANGIGAHSEGADTFIISPTTILMISDMDFDAKKITFAKTDNFDTAFSFIKANTRIYVQNRYYLNSRQILTVVSKDEATRSVTYSESINQTTFKPGWCFNGNFTSTAHCAHAEGSHTVITAGFAHAEGVSCLAKGLASHVEGSFTTANQAFSHAEGQNTIADIKWSHAEGYSSITSHRYAVFKITGVSRDLENNSGTLTVDKYFDNYDYSIGGVKVGMEIKAIGYHGDQVGSGLATADLLAFTVKSYDVSAGTITWEGYTNIDADIQLMYIVLPISGESTSSAACHAEGMGCIAAGEGAHAEGMMTYAYGEGAHASGVGTMATDDGMCAVGTYNVAATADMSEASERMGGGAERNYFIVGNGSMVTNTNNIPTLYRSNGFRVGEYGVYGFGAYNSSGADYAEMFEWLDGNSENEDRRGRFVTLKGNKITLADNQSDFILGIVSGDPSVCGDVHDDQWKGMYLYDIFGSPIYEDVLVPEVTKEVVDPDNTGEKKTIVIKPAHIEKRHKINPEYDPSTPYIPRSKRPEWSAIGLLGKLVVVDDGSCVVDSYVMPTQSGIGTISPEKTRFRMMERLDETHIRVLVLQ